MASPNPPNSTKKPVRPKRSRKLPSALRAVLDFWCGAEGSPDHGVFREIWFRAATAAFDAEIREKFALEGSEAVTACASDDDVAIMLDNLVENAIHYSPPGTTVSIRWGQTTCSAS